MQRHAKKLQRKSRTHEVTMAGERWIVTSGSSGKQYRVRELAGRFWCACDWHKYHSAGECSHTAAVRNWLAECIEGRRVYLSGSKEEYKRRKQRFEDRNGGLIYTSRAVAV